MGSQNDIIRDCHAPKVVLAMTEKDERYKGIMRLPHFLRKFAMTEGGIKYEKVIRKIDSRFRGNDIGVDRGSESFSLFL